MIAFQVAFQDFQAIPWRRTQIIQLICGIKNIHFAEGRAQDTIWKTPGVGSISAVIQVCGGGVAERTNSHPEDYNAFTVSMQDNKWNYPPRMIYPLK
jgi:hypothetical protein